MVAKKPAAKKKAAKKKVVKKKAVRRKVTPKRKSVAKNDGRNGGRRPGAGRKVSSTTKKTREIAENLSDSGKVMPLAYMIDVLQDGPDQLKAQFAAGQIDEVEYAVLLKNNMDRRDWAAEKAAVYIHPRLSSIEANIGLKDQDFFVDLFNKESEG